MGKFCFEKSLTMPKELKGGRFSLSLYCMLREKRGKIVLVEFARPNDSIGTIKFRITIKNNFGQFVWIEKKRITIIVAFHFMKRRLIKLYK